MQSEGGLGIGESTGCGLALMYWQGEGEGVDESM